jgi:hypothetical protein
MMQQRGPGAGAEGGPAQRLLDRKDELGLTGEQVSRLEALAKEWNAAHEPMRAEMQQMREARQQVTQEQRDKLRALREQAQTVGESTRKGVQDVLTDEQRQKLRQGAMGRRAVGQAFRLGRAVGRAGFAPGWQQGFGPQGAPRAGWQRFGPQGAPRAGWAPGPLGWAPQWSPVAPGPQLGPFYRGRVPGPQPQPPAGMRRRWME